MNFEGHAAPGGGKVFLDLLPGGMFFLLLFHPLREFFWLDVAYLVFLFGGSIGYGYFLYWM